MSLIISILWLLWRIALLLPLLQSWSFAWSVWQLLIKWQESNVGRFSTLALSRWYQRYFLTECSSIQFYFRCVHFGCVFFSLLSFVGNLFFQRFAITFRTLNKGSHSHMHAWKSKRIRQYRGNQKMRINRNSNMFSAKMHSNYNRSMADTPGTHHHQHTWVSNKRLLLSAQVNAIPFHFATNYLKETTRAIK